MYLYSWFWLQYALLLLFSKSEAVTVTYNFNITWVTSNPDGFFERPTIGINGQWPLPQIQANVGDNLVINVVNSLGNQSTSLHFHGLFMNGSSNMDGPAQVSQCAIIPGSSFTYRFNVEQAGTYWYHSHTQSQYPDGLRGALIIHDPNSPFQKDYDEELLITVSDWYHEQMATLLPQYMSTGSMSHEPRPNSNLLNDTRDLEVSVQTGKRYMVRMINMGAFVGQYFWIEGHNMTIVEVDGVYTQPAETNMIYVGAGQRCSFIITTRDETAANFPMVASIDTSWFMGHNDNPYINVTGWLVYNPSLPLSKAADMHSLSPIDDMSLVPYDQQPLLVNPARTINLDVGMKMLQDQRSHWLFNNISYEAPKVPSLYTAMTAGSLATDPATYGELTHPFVLEHNEVVEIILNTNHMGRHPFHLHGHQFQAIYRSGDWAGKFEDSGLTDANLPRTPIRRDTLVLNPGGYLVIRFKADNPGVWIFHCHMEWHSHAGLIATMIEAPLTLQQQRPTIALPADHINACSVGGLNLTGIESYETNKDSSIYHSVTETLSRYTTIEIISLVIGFLVIAGALSWVLFFGFRCFRLQKFAYAPVAKTEDHEL